MIFYVYLLFTTVYANCASEVPQSSTSSDSKFVLIDYFANPGGGIQGSLCPSSCDGSPATSLWLPVSYESCYFWEVNNVYWSATNGECDFENQTYSFSTSNSCNCRYCILFTYACSFFIFTFIVSLILALCYMCLLNAI